MADSFRLTPIYDQLVGESLDGGVQPTTCGALSPGGGIICCVEHLGHDEGEDPTPHCDVTGAITWRVPSQDGDNR